MPPIALNVRPVGAADHGGAAQPRCCVAARRSRCRPGALGGAGAAAGSAPRTAPTPSHPADLFEISPDKLTDPAVGGLACRHRFGRPRPARITPSAFAARWLRSVVQMLDLRFGRVRIAGNQQPPQRHAADDIAAPAIVRVKLVVIACPIDPRPPKVRAGPGNSSPAPPPPTRRRWACQAGWKSLGAKMSSRVPVPVCIRAVTECLWFL